ncbi:MAG TPA: ABC transporter permease [Syntrophobacteraceae bacterium]|nr:ABC transporter permease [Syntrophobacteraceae bacterium]
MKNLWFYRTRSALCASAVALSVGVLFSVLSAVGGFEKALVRESRSMGIDFVVAPANCPHEVASLLLYGSVSPSFLDESIVVEIRKTEGVSLATPLAILSVSGIDGKEKLSVYGYEMAHLAKIKPGWQVLGEIPVGWDAIAEQKVLIGWDVAGRYGLEIGDRLPVSGLAKSLVVRRMVRKTYGRDDAFVFAPLRVVRQMAVSVLGMQVIEVKDPSCALQSKITPDPVSAVAIQVEDPARVRQVIRDIETRLPGIEIVPVAQAMESLSELASSAGVFVLAVSVIVLLVSMTAVMNSLLMTVFEMRGQLGMMRAMGASGSDILRFILWFSVIPATAGGITGIGLTHLASPLIARLVETAAPRVWLVMEGFDPVIALKCLLLSTALGCGAGILPAWRASRLKPLDAVRTG